MNVPVTSLGAATQCQRTTHYVEVKKTRWIDGKSQMLQRIVVSLDGSKSHFKATNLLLRHYYSTVVLSTIDVYITSHNFVANSFPGKIITVTVSVDVTIHSPTHGIQRRTHNTNKINIQNTSWSEILQK